MSEQTQNSPNISPAIPELVAREKLAETFADMAAFDPANAVMGIPYVGKEVEEFTHAQEQVPVDILVSYASQLKFRTDRQAEFGDGKPNYWRMLEEIGRMTPANVQSLYKAEADKGDLHAMLVYQVSDKDLSSSFVKPALDVLKSVYSVDTVAELVNDHGDDPVVQELGSALRKGDLKGHDFRIADIGNNNQEGTQEFREWSRNALMLATHISDPEQADAYTYSMSRGTWGTTLGALDRLIERVESFGADKLGSISEFARISALASFSDAQLDRMHKLANNDKAEIDRLKAHDVIVTFINLDGDHNGISSDVAERVDDDAARNIFFEITDPRQIYTDLKKLHDMGINPATLIFATHGSNGQFAISERPSLDSTELTDHVTTVADQELLDVQVAEISPSGKLKGYDITNANGLARAVQRFMQPSRAIDDPEEDLGRKKIISLSCQFDGEAYRGGLGANGEKVRRDKTTLLRRVGEVLVEKLHGERIDIYGADISTNSQTRTPQGFHYNQLLDGFHAPYQASVVHIDGDKMEYEKTGEVKLRKAQ